MRLGWEPKITLESLISEMISHDYKAAKKEHFLIKKGFHQMKSKIKLSKLENDLWYY